MKKKLNAPKIPVRSSSQIDLGILDRFRKHQETFLEYIAACKSVDLDRTTLTSAVAKFVT